MEDLGKKQVWQSNGIFSTQGHGKTCEILRKMMPEDLSTTMSDIKKSGQQRPASWVDSRGLLPFPPAYKGA